MSTYHQPPHTHIQSVHLYVENLERSVSFYETHIGFSVLERTKTQASFTADGKIPLLIIEQPEGIKKKSRHRTGLYHFALLLPSRGDLGRFLKHIVELNYPLQGASD